MKKLLNSLYVNTQGSYIRKERKTIVVKDGDEKLGQFPSLNIANIFCFGRVSMSPPLMGYCVEAGIGVVFFTEYGRFLARVQGKTAGNVLLRRTQYRQADDEEQALSVARLIVAAKIANARAVLQREIRNYGEDEILIDAVRHLYFSCRSTERASSHGEVRGIEGEAATVYFSVFNRLLKGADFVFGLRVRRPPTDPVNAMLSFAYSLLTQECVSALAGVGLDPYVGFLHRDRPGRVSLALDLLEEFRSSWADRLVLTLINRKQLGKTDFITEGSGAVRFTERGKKSFLAAYQERKKSEIMHPYLREKVPIGLLPHCQALLLARYLRGDLEFYPPYLVK